MEKTAKIISVQENQKQYSGKAGIIFVHLIRFENDIENKLWEYHSKSEKCDNFKEGQVQTFQTEIKQNGTYTNYLIKPASTGTGTNKGANKDSGIITYLSCLSSAANFYANQKPSTWQDVMDAAEQGFKKATEKSTLK